MSWNDDLVKLAQLYVDVKECPGGRATHAVYMCHICGHDYSQERACGAPTQEAKKTMRRGKDGLWRPLVKVEWEP